MAGSKSEVIEIVGRTTKVSDLLRLIGERHRSLAEHLSLENEEESRRRLLVAVDTQLVSLADTIEDGRTVKILPPLSGGL